MRKTERVRLPKAALAYYHSLGITALRVLTDNGFCYRSFAFRAPAAISGSNTSAPAPYTPDQRQGRLFHPDRAARMSYAQAYPLR